MKRHHLSLGARIALLACACLIAFSYGASIGALHYPPYSIFKSIYVNSFADMHSYESIEPRYRTTDVETLITVRTMAAVRERRLTLQMFLWSDGALPSSVPYVEKNITDDTIKDIERVIRVDRLTVVMDWNITSVAYHFIPTEPNGRVIIYAAGHNSDFRHDTKTIQAFIDRGYSVVGISMPLTGMNSRPIVELDRVGKLRIDQHDQLHFLHTNKTNPLKFFVEPIVSIVNYLEPQYVGVDMIGLSGGGFMTTLAAAVDERIQHSYPVAGTLPFYLLSGSEGTWGDYESTNPQLHRIANYPELYILGASGTNRTQTQVLNQYDSCCYAGIGYETYVNQTANAVERIGSGNFSVYLDTSHRDHQISEEAITVLFGKAPK